MMHSLYKETALLLWGGLFCCFGKVPVGYECPSVQVSSWDGWLSYPLIDPAGQRMQ